MNDFDDWDAYSEYDPGWNGSDDDEELEEDDFDQYLEEHDREINQWIGWEMRR